MNLPTRFRQPHKQPQPDEVEKQVPDAFVHQRSSQHRQRLGVSWHKPESRKPSFYRRFAKMVTAEIDKLGDRHQQDGDG